MYGRLRRSFFDLFLSSPVSLGKKGKGRKQARENGPR
jgi:hypothetical protein